jgi:hypothetical protein
MEPSVEALRGEASEFCPRDGAYEVGWPVQPPEELRHVTLLGYCGLLVTSRPLQRGKTTEGALNLGEPGRAIRRDLCLEQALHREQGSDKL